MGSGLFVVILAIVLIIALAWIGRSSRGRNRRPEEDPPRGDLGSAYRPDDERPNSHPR